MTEQPQPSGESYACALSLQIGEQLFGTATRVDVWLLLEHNGPWGAEALAESNIPQPVKDRIDHWLAAIPNARTQLIRRQSGPTPTPKAFYIAISREANAALYKFQLTEYDDLLSMDVPAIAAGDAAYQQYRSDDLVFLVCTNGRRDKCCGKFGAPIYEAMSQFAIDSVWQTTHLAGHRFAPTAVFLPHGIAYGRIDAGDVELLVSEYRDLRIYLPKYRGRSCYDEVVQAAEYYLRVQQQAPEIDLFRFIDARQSGPDRWAVRFESRLSGTQHEINLAQHGLEVYKNSGDPKRTLVPQYQPV